MLEHLLMDKSYLMKAPWGGITAALLFLAICEKQAFLAFLAFFAFLAFLALLVHCRACLLASVIRAVGRWRARRRTQICSSGVTMSLAPRMFGR